MTNRRVADSIVCRTTVLVFLGKIAINVHKTPFWVHEMMDVYPKTPFWVHEMMDMHPKTPFWVHEMMDVYPKMPF
ncbi:MAG: hypothetical protein J6T06_07365 [Victivallales bacterium]|nr:hypothetical protein [Victivallales bacterium]